jgi:hypothetical protein
MSQVELNVTAKPREDLTDSGGTRLQVFNNCWTEDEQKAVRLDIAKHRPKRNSSLKVRYAVENIGCISRRALISPFPGMSLQHVTSEMASEVGAEQDEYIVPVFGVYRFDILTSQIY